MTGAFQSAPEPDPTAAQAQGQSAAQPEGQHARPERLSHGSDAFDYEATQEVLRRAFEIAQRQLEEPTEVYLSRGTLAEIALEVGLPSSALAAAIAERQLGLDEEAGLLDRVLGPRMIAAQRASAHDERYLTERTVEWLENGHGMKSRVRQDGVVIANKRRDVVGKVANTLRSTQGQGGLGKVQQVTAVAVDLDDDPGAVVLAADVGDKRNEAILGGVAVTAGASLAVGAISIVAGPLVLIGLPVAAGVGVLTSRTVHQGTVRDVEHEVESTIDQVVKGQRPPSLLGAVAKESIARRLQKRQERTAQRAERRAGRRSNRDNTHP